MSPPECGHCHREVPDGAPLCSPCAVELASQLRGVPDLIEQLFVTFTKQDQLGAAGARAKQVQAPLPVRLDVTRVIDAVSNEMTTWARVLVDHHGLDVPGPPRRRPHNTSKPVVKRKPDDQGVEPLGRHRHGSGRGLPVFPVSSPAVDLACYAASWLADHAGRLRTHPAALEARRDLTAAIAAAEAAIDRPELQLYVGACGLCGAALYAPRDALGTRCERCGVYFADVGERWDRALRKLRGYPATAAVFAGSIGELYGVTINRKVVNKWHERGQIRKVDDDPNTGAPRFRIGALLDRAANSKPRNAVAG